ncbi:MAG: hypothetical protein K2M29_09190 [Paramuribaculum sp.]|nr:hypothetical protein [Paramuribaculum sp.]
MKRILLTLILTVITCTAAIGQVEIGLQNSRYGYLGYTLKDHWNFRLRQSLFSERMRYQQIQLEAAYLGSIGHFDYSGGIYGSTEWGGDWRTGGVKIRGQFNTLKRLHINATINPHYDSEYDYTTCFSVGAEVDIIKSISILASYTTIPDYRKSEKRIHGGASFHVGQLSVTPEISIPVSSSERLKQMRILTSFGYKF